MTSFSWIITTPCTGTVIFCVRSPLATAWHTLLTSCTCVFSSFSSSTAVMPLSIAAVSSGPGGTTLGLFSAESPTCEKMPFRCSKCSWESAAKGKESAAWEEARGRRQEGQKAC